MAAQGSQRPVRILVIEDHPDMLENMTELLELAGYELRTASNAQDGLDLALEFRPSIILCDIIMPEMDGFAMLNEIRNCPIRSKIPVVLTTARSEKKDIDKGLSLGAAGYIVKPFTEEMLLATIRKFVV